MLVVVETYHQNATNLTTLTDSVIKADPADNHVVDVVIVLAVVSANISGGTSHDKPLGVHVVNKDGPVILLLVVDQRHHAEVHSRRCCVLLAEGC